MKIPSSNLGRTCCVQKLFLTFRTISFVHNIFSPCSAKRRASDKDLPVQWVYNGKRDTFKKCKNYIEYICSGHHLSTMAFIFILNSKGVTICILFSLGTQLNAFLEICKCIVILWAAAWNLIHLFWFIFANIHAKMCF